MNTATSARTARSTTSTGWVPFAILALVAIPAVAGTLRVAELFGGPQLLPPNVRFEAFPGPVVVHIISAILYAILGAFQFLSGRQQRTSRWHRRAGRLVVALGLAVALSALWMTLFYPRQPGTGELAYLFRLAFGSAMAVSVLLGFTAIRHGYVTRHRAWMTRAYALALAAGTQVFTLGAAQTLFGASALARDLALGAGWIINLAIAEYVIRRRPRRRAAVAPTLASRRS